MPLPIWRRDQVLALQYLQHGTDGAARHAKFFGEVALGGQALFKAVVALEDLASQAGDHVAGGPTDAIASGLCADDEVVRFRGDLRIGWLMGFKPGDPSDVS